MLRRAFRHPWLILLLAAAAGCSLSMMLHLDPVRVSRPKLEQLAGFDIVDEAPATMGKVVGFDVGGESTMVVDDSGVIVRNELGGHSSSSLVGFSGMERYVGEAAVAQLSTNAKNTARIGERLSGNGAGPVRVRP